MIIMKNRVAFLVLILLIGIVPGFSQNEVNNVPNTPSVRQHLLMDFGWKFSYGHGKSFENDFLSGTGYFSYFAKTGYGDGPASTKFKDDAW